MSTGHRHPDALDGAWRVDCVRCLSLHQPIGRTGDRFTSAFHRLEQQYPTIGLLDPPIALPSAVRGTWRQRAMTTAAMMRNASWGMVLDDPQKADQSMVRVMGSEWGGDPPMTWWTSRRMRR